MALIQLRCPSCNGSIQMDDTKETGFCMYCGSRFMVRDEILRVVHGGSVEIDREKEIVNLNFRANQKIDQIVNAKEPGDTYIKQLEEVKSTYIEKLLDIDALHPRTFATKDRIEQLIRERRKQDERGNNAAMIILMVGVLLFVVIMFFALKG